jgi:hypothetical protein
MPFLDDIEIKKPRSRYNDEEVFGFPGVRRFILKYIQSLDAVLADLERAGFIISAEKSVFYIIGLKIVGYVYDINGRHSNFVKVLKILEWDRCDDVAEARAFIGICGYYRIWVAYYTFIAEPIYQLF